MSAYSTLRITRSKAKEMFLEELLGDLQDEMLEAFLDRKLQRRLYNARVVPDGCENDNCEL